jgi:hypothetical protein
MSLDAQVLVIALFAVALKLLLWTREEGVAGGMSSRIGRTCFTLITTGCDSKRERGQPELRTESLHFSIPGWIGHRYV